MELIKSSQAVWFLISGPAPERAYCSCLTTYRLLFAPSELWQEGFQQQLWSLSACHLALVAPWAERPLCAWKDRILNGRWDECGTICSVWQSKRLGVSWHTVVCAARLRPVTTRCVLSLQLYLLGPHNSIKTRPWGQSCNIHNNEWLIWQDLHLESMLWAGYNLFNSKILGKKVL